MLRLGICFSLVLSVFISSAQIIEEKIQLDTVSQIIRVIYRSDVQSTYYYKKVAVFADDTAQIAVEKSYNKYGQNGLYQAYYPSGRLKVKTVFANDKINGEWIYYDTKGIIITKGIYKAGIKHGFWAYKSLRIYGRYKKGLKNKKWKRFDKNENKYLSHYKNGVLTGGEGFGNEEPVILYEKDTVNNISWPAGVTVKGEPIQKYKLPEISKEYQQAISFLTNNDLFRRTIKKHFGGSIKKHFKKGIFQFTINPTKVALDISTFIKDSENDKIIVAKIDSILKMEKQNLKVSFSGNELAWDENSTLREYSTANNVHDNPIVIYFSELKYNILRIDVINYPEVKVSHFDYGVYETIKENLKFQILLYFNNEGVLKGAEYQKR